jgi:hypothetical protein
MTANELLEQKNSLISYLLQKVRYSDWHAVADAAMDLREVEARLDMLAARTADEMAVATDPEAAWAKRLGR